MSITAKELARKIGVSAAAVSMALNNKPGVSRKTRQLILDEAEKNGYDFSRLSVKKQEGIYISLSIKNMAQLSQILRSSPNYLTESAKAVRKTAIR